MPKMKTHRGAAKRFRKNGNGKIKRSKAYASHCLNRKTSKQKRSLTQSAIMHSTNEKRVNGLIPYK